MKHPRFCLRLLKDSAAKNIESCRHRAQNVMSSPFLLRAVISLIWYRECGRFLFRPLPAPCIRAGAGLLVSPLCHPAITRHPDPGILTWSRARPPARPAMRWRRPARLLS